ncbi:MAG: hypothetical protein Q4C95_02575 [Planctomycetia bacterium]|nr:hypothetical protein [Planctomycetia bacterium]
MRLKTTENILCVLAFLDLIEINLGNGIRVLQSDRRCQAFAPMNLTCY